MARILGLGTLNKVDDDDSGTVFTTLSLMVGILPPPRRRVRVEGTALADTLATDAAGIEDKSDYEFTHYYEPGGTNDTIVITLFEAKTAILWQITYANGDTETFEGIVMAIEPQEARTAEHLMRKVTVHRTGAITFA